VSAQQETKARPLPENGQALRPGEYHSVKFKPSLSFKVGKGWSYAGGEASDLFYSGMEESGDWAS
jgi:hypothetical protein